MVEGRFQGYPKTASNQIYYLPHDLSWFGAWFEAKFDLSKYSLTVESFRLLGLSTRQKEHYSTGQNPRLAIKKEHILVHISKLS